MSNQAAAVNLDRTSSTVAQPRPGKPTLRPRITKGFADELVLAIRSSDTARIEMLLHQGAGSVQELGGKVSNLAGEVGVLAAQYDQHDQELSRLDTRLTAQEQMSKDIISSGQRRFAGHDAEIAGVQQRLETIERISTNHGNYTLEVGDVLREVHAQVNHLLQVEDARRRMTEEAQRVHQQRRQNDRKYAKTMLQAITLGAIITGIIMML